MTDQLDTAVRNALRDIISAAPAADRRPTPVDLVDKIRDRPRRGLYLAVAATLVVGVGIAGILAIDTKRAEPDTSQSRPDRSPTNSTGREDGAITDPRAIDFAPWLTGAPEWPGLYQPDYVIFDVAALDGWTKVDESGWHEFDDGGNYVWASNVNDSEGHQFHLVISNSDLYPRVVTGDKVDINGAAGIATEGELSWPLDDYARHIATVTEFGTADPARAIALAKKLTTTTVSTISIGGLGAATETLADPAAPFAGVVDGFTWTASATPNSMTFIIDQTLSVNNTSDAQPLSTSPTQIIQVAGNDLCVFIAGYVPDVDNVRLVLSDQTAIALPTQRLDNGEHWFAACVPYALDATAVEVGSSRDEPVLHQLNWPLLRPTLGQRVTGAASGLSQAVERMLEADLRRVCGTPDFNQVTMVASALQADGNRLELWIAPTDSGRGMTVLLGLRHNGEVMKAASSCDEQIEKNYAWAGTEVADGETKGIIDITGRTDPTAAQARITFTSGKVVVADVQSDGYFVLSLLDTVSGYSQVKAVEPIH